MQVPCVIDKQYKYLLDGMLSIINNALILASSCKIAKILRTQLNI